MNRQPAPVILVIDEDAEARNWVSGRLRRNGFTVVTAANGFQGLATLAARPVSLVLCAQNLPGRSGTSVLAAQREREAAEQRTPTPFVLMSAHGVPELLAAGSNLYQPVAADQVVTLVHSQLAASALLGPR